MVLEVQSRDGAGRIAHLQLGDRRIELPGLFWHADRVPPGPGEWRPLLDQRENPTANLVATRRFMDAPPIVSSNQILLQRRLRPTASMLASESQTDAISDDVVVWWTAFDLLKDVKHFAAALPRARTDAGFARALYAPGLGEPAAIALLTYAGIDLFDATPLLLAAARGRYLTTSGSFHAKELLSGECVCPACHGEPPASFTAPEIAAHNQYAARAELGVVRNAVRAGRLRELVEARVRAHPELTALLRRVDTNSGHLEARTPIHRSRTLHATTKESLQRVECVRFRDRVAKLYRPPMSPPVLLLLPCSHRKPYSMSRTHRTFGDAIWNAGAAGLVHEVILTSPLGMVPRELELTYPAAHYDVPVTGEWDEEEGRMIRDLLTGLFAKRSYARVVSHLPRHTYDLVKDLLPVDTIVTCEGENATANPEVRRLEESLRALGRDLKRVNLQVLLRERLRAIADYQFGPAAADLLFEGTTVVGKWPTGKLLANGEQLAMLPTERGQLSLTMAGGARLLAAGAHRVEIEDFKVKGGVFAVGVRGADPEIRPGDEVVVHHKGELRAVGTAMMSGPEMVELKRGEAVNARHHA